MTTLTPEQERDVAERKAVDSLARYKFTMFGYWSGVWVHLNRLCADRKPNPFKPMVQAARQIQSRRPPCNEAPLFQTVAATATSLSAGGTEASGSSAG